MRRIGRIPVLAIAGLLSFSSVAYGDDLAEVRTLFEKDIHLLNAHNNDAFSIAAHEDVVLFGIFSPFPVEGKEKFRQAVQEYFNNYEHAVITLIDPDYKAMGATGVAWGNFRLATRRKGGAQEYTDGRYMVTYTRANGKWHAISMHYSLLEPLVK